MLLVVLIWMKKLLVRVFCFFFVILNSVFDIRCFWQVTRYACDPVARDPCNSLKIPAAALRLWSFTKKTGLQASLIPVFL